MDQEKIGSLLKKIRKDNNLTQEKFAEQLGVTPQAVSKWENGKNIPDLSILKEIKKLYNIDLDSILDGENNKKKNTLNYIVIGCLIVLIMVLIFLVFFKKDKDDFKFNQIGTTCSNFKISGTAAYNKNKTGIHITNIEYCGEINNEVYSKIECNLYESYKDTDKKINSCGTKKNTKLEEFLKNLDIKIEHDSSTCNLFKDSKIYLELKVTNKDKDEIIYKIPIELEENC